MRVMTIWLNLVTNFDSADCRAAATCKAIIEHYMAEQLIRVARIAELPPGKMRRVDVGKLRILLANVDGQFYATDDTCSHEDASLSTGFLKGEWVKCPLHGSRFNVRTGEVADEPAEVNLRTYDVRIDGNDICLNLA